ncbi:hypothetical protein [Sutcliffiella sp. FSL R7-0096]|uniref:hypothetical protein n=1 Tax=Sutcliffiella sp. FSL R7-0096 TaxID=2921670 RepID=UPI003159EDD9
MEYSKLVFSVLRENMYADSWVSSNNHNGLYTYTLRDNISISITELPERNDNKVSNEFTERFMNKNAKFHHYSLNYNGAVVKTVLLFSVDGGRALIPSPKLINENFIEDDDIVISVIIDKLVFDSRYENTTHYLKKAKLVYQESLVD